jgi:hypothetical protein
MSVLAAILIATQSMPTQMIVSQPMSMASVQVAPYNLTDCKMVFIPMNYDPQQRPVDKRVRGKSRPMQKQLPNPRPCFTRASG